MPSEVALEKALEALIREIEIANNAMRNMALGLEEAVVMSPDLWRKLVKTGISPTENGQKQKKTCPFETK